MLWCRCGGDQKIVVGAIVVAVALVVVVVLLAVPAVWLLHSLCPRIVVRVPDLFFPPGHDVS